MADPRNEIEPLHVAGGGSHTPTGGYAWAHEQASTLVEIRDELRAIHEVLAAVKLGKRKGVGKRKGRK